MHSAINMARRVVCIPFAFMSDSVRSSVHRLRSVGTHGCNGLGVRRHKVVRVQNLLRNSNSVEVHDSRYSYLLKPEKYFPSPDHPRVKVSDHGSKGIWGTRYVDSPVSPCV